METVHATIMNSCGFLRATIIRDGRATQIASSACPDTSYDHCKAAIEKWAADHGYTADVFLGSATLTPIQGDVPPEA